MLRAAMIAVGGQYSCDYVIQYRSRSLHDQSLRLLDKVALLLELTSVLELSAESDWQTEDSMSDMGPSQSLTDLLPSILLAASALYEHFQVWHDSRNPYPLKNQEGTDQSDSNYNGSTSGGATSNSTSESTNLPSSRTTEMTMRIIAGHQGKGNSSKNQKILTADFLHVRLPKIMHFVIGNVSKMCYRT